jgi:hypothetical protein
VSVSTTLVASTAAGNDPLCVAYEQMVAATTVISRWKGLTI